MTQEKPSLPSSLPILSPERLDQMIHLALNTAQEKKTLPWHQRLFQPFASKQKNYGYSLGAAALVCSCLAAFWMMPALSPQIPPETTMKPSSQIATNDANLSEYMLIELFDDLG